MINKVTALSSSNLYTKYLSKKNKYELLITSGSEVSVFDDFNKRNFKYAK